jgi:hypothetical protein
MSLFEASYAEEPEFKPLEVIAQRTQLAIYVNLALSVFTVPVTIPLLEHHTGHAVPISAPEGLLAGVVYAVHLASYLAAAVMFCIWMCRAQINSMRLAATEPPSPKAEQTACLYAVGPWFIPIVNLFTPFQNMMKLWRATTPTSAPLAGSSAKVPSEMKIWWGMWVAMQLFDRFIGTSVFLLCVDVLIRIITGILAARVVSAITRRQLQQIHLRAEQR